MTAIHRPLGERGRVAFAAGQIHSAKRERLATLRARVEQTADQFRRYPSGYTEIEKARAEQDLEDFLEANPEPTDA